MDRLEKVTDRFPKLTDRISKMMDRTLKPVDSHKHQHYPHVANDSIWG